MRPGSPLGHSGYGRTYRKIAGTLSVALWNSQVGISQSSGVTVSWTDQLQTIAVPAAGVPNRPPYAADGSRWAGKSVVHSAVSGSKALSVAGLATLVASGTRPCLYMRGRFKAIGAAAATFVDFGVLAVSDDMKLQLDASATKFALYGSPTTELVGSTADTSPHSLLAWADGTNRNLKVDATTSQGASAASLAHNVTAIGIGKAASGSYQFNDAAFALIFLMSAYSAAVVAAIDALGTAEFPP